MLACRSEPGEERCRNGRSQAGREGHRESSPEPGRTSDRSHQHVVKPALGLLGAGRGDLACGEEGNENREDEKARAEDSMAPEPGAPSLEKTSLDEPESVVPADLAMSPKSSADKDVDTHQPMTLARCIRMASPVGPKSSQSGPGVRPVGHDAFPDVTPARKGDRAATASRR